MQKKFFIGCFLAVGLSINSFAMPNKKWVEELIIKDDKIVMIRDGGVQKDYFFHIDKIAFIEKDSKSISKKYIIGLEGGKLITIYNLDNYRKLMKIFLNMSDYNNISNKQVKQSNKTPVVGSGNNKPYVSNSDMEEKEIEKMNINSQEKIIALDPLDIQEH